MDRAHNKLLLLGGALSVAAALAHLLVIVGGPDWYRAFGAGEGMARLAESGSLYPAMVTMGIASVLFVWAMYAFSAAGLIRRLPLLRLALVIIAAVLLLRGLLGVPVVMLADGPHLNELRQSLTFMIISSFICLLIGLCYAAGTAQAWPNLAKPAREVSTNP